MKTILFSER